MHRRDSAQAHPGRQVDVVLPGSAQVSARSRMHLHNAVQAAQVLGWDLQPLLLALCCRAACSISCGSSYCSMFLVVLCWAFLWFCAAIGMLWGSV